MPPSDITYNWRIKGAFRTGKLLSFSRPFTLTAMGCKIKAYSGWKGECEKMAAGMECRIRPAVTEDARALTEIAFAAKRRWDYPETYYDTWKDELTVTTAYLLSTPVFVAVREEDPVGFLSLAHVEQSFWAGRVFVREGDWLEHLFVLPPFHGRDIGSALVRHALRYAAHQGIKRLYLFSDPHATGFYEKLGARFLELSPSSIPGRSVPLYELAVRGKSHRPPGKTAVACPRSVWYNKPAAASYRLRRTTRPGHPEKQRGICMELTEKTLEKNTVYSGKIISLRRDLALLPDGHQSVREVVEHPGGVCIAALTEQDELLFVRQFRYPYKKEILELPAGKLTPGENPLDCGKRELQEETGAQAARYESLGELYPSPGYTNEIIYLYEAKGLRFGGQQLDDDEFLEVIRLPLQKAVDMVLRNEIPDAKTQTAVLKVWCKKQAEEETSQP